MLMMDLERIKQNLRIRSGRGKKARRPPAPPTQLVKSDTPVAEVRPGVPVDQKSKTQIPIPNTKTEKDKLEHHTEQSKLDTDSSLRDSKQQRPSLPHASTEMNGAPVGPTRSQREIPQFGRSGIEKPAARPLPPPVQRAVTDPKMSSDESDVRDYDLRPPPRKPKPPSLEKVSELLFSEGHLNAVLHDSILLHGFTNFLHRYKSHLSPILISYLETQKAVKAVEYANAVAAAVAPIPNSDDPDQNITPKTAARIDETFAAASRAAFLSLVSEALPAYVTYTLVKVVTECLTNEITGRSTPIMRDLVGGLSEIFCLTDPNQEDNPIIYASEEFFRLTGYDFDDVIGNNCRFLQGPKTGHEAPKRLRAGQEKMEQTCETLLNYRRDGRAFLNLLMIAPLYDDQQQLKYYIGAQVDVSRLVEGGRGLDSLSRYLTKRNRDERGRAQRREDEADEKKAKALEKLRELSEMFDLEESAIVRSHSRESSLSRDDESVASKERPRSVRRVIPDKPDFDDNEEADTAEEEEKSAWSLAASGPSGGLPGVYERYMLIRPAPSLRIIFVSPKLRSLGNIMQNPLLSHIAASANTLAGLKESFFNAVPVTAKIRFMPEAGEFRDGTRTDDPNTKRTEQDEAVKRAKTCWVSATPLLGGDGSVGVWMVVVVQKGKGMAKAAEQRLSSKSVESLERNDSVEQKLPRRKREFPLDESPTTPTPTLAPKPKLDSTDLPIKPRRLYSSDFTPPASMALPEKSNRREMAATQAEPLKAEGFMNANARDLDVPEEGNQEDINDEDVFVRRHNARSPLRSERLIIQSDTEDDEPRGASPMAGETDGPPEGEYEAASRPDSPPDEDQTTIKNTTPPLTPRTYDIAKDDQNPQSLPDFSFSSSRSSSSRGPGPESNSARPAGMLYMDYLRHPGSRDSRGSAMPRNGNDDDSDCTKTPYSLD